MCHFEAAACVAKRYEVFFLFLQWERELSTAHRQHTCLACLDCKLKKGLMMTSNDSSNSRLAWWVKALLLVAGGMLIAWQFLTFKQLLEAHTLKAQQTSRSASWAGQPVGTMVQVPPPSDRLAEHLPAENIGFMRTALPWNH